MLSPIYFAGVMGPCETQYGIHIEEDTLHIIVIQSKFGTSLWNSAEARNHVLNTVLSRDVAGIRIDQIRFHVILDTRTNGMLGIELPIHLDHVDAYAGPGGSISGGGSFNPSNGQLAVSFDLGVGVGIGGGARYNPGYSVTLLTVLLAVALRN